MVLGKKGSDIMLVLLNKYNYIIGYCDKGYESEGYIEIDTKDLNGEELCFNYQYINEKLIKNIPKPKPLGIKLEYDGNIWIETSPIEEQRECWLNKILEINKEIEQYKILGFEGRKELIDLENKLQKYKLKYSSTFEDEAIKMDKHIQSTKPIK